LAPFKGLQKVCQKNGATFLLDEIQTGGGPTGKMWAHEHFDLPESPDIVTFRFQCSVTRGRRLLKNVQELAKQPGLS
jgi:hypothetical protein